METFEELMRLLKIFFDPVTILFWVIVAIITVAILRMIYKKEDA